jgi:hypothetical protein
MSEHIWFQENLAGYCAGGLTIEERERFDRHRIACSTCAKMLAEYQGFDEAIDSLFAPTRPRPGWENRVIDNMRLARRKRLPFSWWLGAAGSVAALVMLGVVGALLYDAVQEGELTFPGQVAQARTQAKNNLHQSSQGWGDWAALFGHKSSVNDADGEDKATKDAFPGLGESSGKSGELSAPRRPVFTDSLEALGGVVTRDEKTVAAGEITAFGRKLSENKEHEGLQRELADKLSQMVTALGDQNKWMESYDAPSNAPGYGERGASVAGGFYGRSGATRQATPSDQAAGKGSAPPAATAPALPPGTDWGVTVNGSLNDNSDRTRVLALQPAIPQETLGSNQTERRARTEPKYFAPRLDVTAPAVAGQPASSADKGNAGEKESGVVKQAGSSVPFGEKGKDGKAEPTKEPAQPETSPAPTTPRKIIRTGEIEFEIESFDAAVAGITKLVNGTAGAFITTVNSDKLPNGKVKGSIVVRVPPEKLDKFLADLRAELGKTGELKSQRIGSQDVTKQYTDVESRLRGARAMEQRFLEIIKTGKGDIKDLVAAENALGVWRTKIEEMEGEVRYYNSQVGLSTLTITLYEKEIQAPAALVVTERLKMQLEVDDVEKAQKAALAAVAEAKGRVTKSELKQHAAGQLEAVLYFEVSPAAADKVKDRLKGLGVVTHQDVDRSQQTQGARSPNLDIKTKQNDVKFEVGMYNVANVQPREVLVIQLASLDVPASFRKLQEAAAAAKSQVRTAQLNEQDKLNVSAQFDFDVLTADKKTIDEALALAGKVISRHTTQAAPGEAATSRKVGYRLALRNVAALPSRERVSLGIEVKDVDQTAADILEMVKSRQGHLAGAQMNHERTGRVSAILVFDVPLSVKEELVRQLKTAGIVRLQTATRNPQVPDNDLATAHIDVTLTSAGPIVPSDEGLWQQIRTSLFYSFRLLSWSLMFVILGLSVLLPWLLLIWGGYKLVTRWRRRPA